MTFKCVGCNSSTEWDPIKRGGSMPPGFDTRKINGQNYTLCTGCLGDMGKGVDYNIDDPAVPSHLRNKIQNG